MAATHRNTVTIKSNEIHAAIVLDPTRADCWTVVFHKPEPSSYDTNPRPTFTSLADAMAHVAAIVVRMEF